MTIKGSSIKFRSPRLSILIAALDDLPDSDANVATVLAVGCGVRPQPRSGRMPAAETRRNS